MPPFYACFRPMTVFEPVSRLSKQGGSEMRNPAWRHTIFTTVMALSCGRVDTRAATAEEQIPATTVRMISIGGEVVVAPAQTEAAEGARITLRVRNDAELPSDLLADTKATVSAIYEKADIDATFVDAYADFMIVLLPRHTADNMRQIPNAVGFAPGSGTAGARIAYVLSPGVDKIANGYNIPRAIVLAVVIAHEVGHLLIVNAHSPTGIMRPAWNQTDFRQATTGRLLFTRQQAEQMRARLARNGAPVR
jgi:hypothetical protein